MAGHPILSLGFSHPKDMSRTFPTLFDGGKFNSSPRNDLWAEAVQTATMFQKNLVSQPGALTPITNSLGREEDVF